MMFGFWAVARKEFTHIFRDRGSLVLALMIPIFQVCMYGYAIDFDVRHIPTVLVDFDRSNESRQYVRELHATQYLDFDFAADSPEEAATMLRSGQARAAVLIPPDFTRRLEAGDHPQVGVLVDGSDSQVALRARLAFTKPSSAPPGTQVEARQNVLFNPNSRTAVFMIPGLIGLILQLILTALTSGSLVREREQGSLEQLMVTPVTKSGLMLGKLAPFFALALFEMALILTIGYILFDVRPVGSVPLLFVMSVPFITASLGVGLFISAVAKTQAQSSQLSTFFFLPQILLSGFIFPKETMPGFLQLIAQFIPLSHELNILRGIVVRGAGYGELWPSFVATILLATFWIVLAASRFQKIVS